MVTSTSNDDNTLASSCIDCIKGLACKIVIINSFYVAVATFVSVNNFHEIEKALTGLTTMINFQGSYSHVRGQEP